MPQSARSDLFFDSRFLPRPVPAYVVWLDVMGTAAIMSRSLDITSNFVFKLHSAVLDAAGTDIKLYPVMDGVYAVAEALCQAVTDR